MAEVRIVRVELSGGQQPYADSTHRAVIDFDPEGTGGWGCAPNRDTARDVYRALCRPGALNSPSSSYGERITSCEPEEGSERKGMFADPESPTATRWVVTSRVPYTG